MEYIDLDNSGRGIRVDTAWYGFGTGLLWLWYPSGTKGKLESESGDPSWYSYIFLDNICLHPFEVYCYFRLSHLEISLGEYD